MDKPLGPTQSKPKVIALVGPTASGKTALGIALARKLRGEVISADSRQIYKGMDLIAGTATGKEMSGVPHHLLRIADPKRQFSAGAFAKTGEKLIAQITKHGHLPIVVGGTGFYTQALLGDTLPEVPPNTKLRRELSKKSVDELFSLLKKLDRKRAGTIDAQNPVRLVRAIEIATALGKVPAIKKNEKFAVLWLGLEPPADKAYEKKIRARVTARLKRGMVAEAKALRASVSHKRWFELGVEFRLLGDLLDKKISREDFVARLTAWELLYAKRQTRYLRRNSDIKWIKNEKQAIKLVKAFLR